jgi:hypothetical protein
MRTYTMKTGIMIVVCALLLGGCQSIIDNRRQRNEEVRATIPYCIGLEQCKKAWTAARYWITNSGFCYYALKEGTYIKDIETGIGHGGTSCQVFSSREVPGEHSYKLIFLIYCKSPICPVDKHRAKMEFNRYVSSAIME